MLSLTKATYATIDEVQLIKDNIIYFGQWAQDHHRDVAWLKIY